MPRKPTELALNWRSENYGSIQGSVAFRVFAEPVLSETAHARLGRIYRGHGFYFDYARASWIARNRPASAPVDLVRALKDAGYAVRNDGCVPRSLTHDPRLEAGALALAKALGEDCTGPGILDDASPRAREIVDLARSVLLGAGIALSGIAAEADGPDRERIAL